MFDWERSIYIYVTYILPEDNPTPLENNLTTVSYVDAILFNYIVTGKYITLIIHLYSKTLID